MRTNVSESDVMRSIHKWLYDKKQELGIQIGTYGAEYKNKRRWKYCWFSNV